MRRNGHLDHVLKDVPNTLAFETVYKKVPNEYFPHFKKVVPNTQVFGTSTRNRSKYMYVFGTGGTDCPKYISIWHRLSKPFQIHMHLAPLLDIVLNA